jgi:hypothetical protein
LRADIQSLFSSPFNHLIQGCLHELPDSVCIYHGL